MITFEVYMLSQLLSQLLSHYASVCSAISLTIMLYCYVPAAHYIGTVVTTCIHWLSCIGINNNYGGFSGLEIFYESKL